MKNNNFNIDDLIAKIDAAAGSYTSYEKIAEAAKIRVETLWKIRTKKHDPKTRIARNIVQALEELKRNPNRTTSV